MTEQELRKLRQEQKRKGPKLKIYLNGIDAGTYVVFRGNKLRQSIVSEYGEILVWKDQKDAVARAHSWGFGWNEIVKGWLDLKALDLHRFLDLHKEYPPEHRKTRLEALGNIEAVADGLHGDWVLGFYDGEDFLGVHKTKRGGGWRYGTLGTVAKHAAELGFQSLKVRLPEIGSPEVRTSKKYGTCRVAYPEDR